MNLSRRQDGGVQGREGDEKHKALDQRGSELRSGL